MVIDVSHYLVVRAGVVQTILPLAHVDLVVILHAYPYARYMVGNVT